jgi:altronate dehydratase large subunit
MKDNIDFDMSRALEGTISIDDLGEELFREIIAVINGKKTKAEVYGFGFTETVISRVCDYV